MTHERAGRSRSGKSELDLARRLRLVECAAEAAAHLGDLVLGDDERWREGDAVADRAHDQAVLQGEVLDQRADLALGRPRRTRLAVLHQLDTAEQADAAYVADQRMAGERRQPV